MTRIKDENRKRKYRPKSKNGCATCKARHVRCDETRPQCRKCTSRGRPCPGYGNDPSTQDLRIELSTSASVFESRNEHRAFAYFQRRTSEHLAGLVESEIWSRTLLQIARSDESVRHALIALASVHEDYEQVSESGLQTSEFALRQYNRAIRGHMERSQASKEGTGDVESYLASCMIFICIEMLQSHPASAISLIKQAVGLFYSLPATMPGGPTSIWPLEMFEALLCRFQFMAVNLVGRATYDGTVPPRMKAASTLPMPRHFDNVRQAKDYLDFYIMSYELSRRPSSKGYIRDPTEQDSKALEAIAAYRDILVRWSSAFAALKFQCNVDPHLNDRDRRALEALDIRHRFLTSLADFSRWDHAGKTFGEILDVIERMLAQLNSGCPFTNPRRDRLFTLELGLISPLYTVARGCRDPQIRRRAIGLLKSNDIREGLWDSQVAARVAERIMELEEEVVEREIESAADVPQWARIPETALVFDTTHRTMTIRVSRRRCNVEPDQLKDVEEVVALHY